ncbi:hypothetical protein ASF48_05045 [Rathayibacter sp. Leaf299]|uniref:hypothetical protein n=1 Tax=Rathayibacter sp. Leaf299 TaxID=1736328 RepID=UPI0006F87790|nr:hypothetical protein [Rathayibacter sp. Leaf299]KQQ22553.1 hypothetical protein ASF48_05045 [Rathayibacter sp. Leaf299]
MTDLDHLRALIAQLEQDANRCTQPSIEANIREAAATLAVFKEREAALFHGRLPEPREDTDLDALAEALANTDDGNGGDGCFDRIREWESQEEWEREAHRDNDPGSDYEDREYWRRLARTALAHPRRTVETAEEWKDRVWTAWKAYRDNHDEMMSTHLQAFRAGFAVASPEPVPPTPEEAGQ